MLPLEKRGKHLPNHQLLWTVSSCISCSQICILFFHLSGSKHPKTRIFETKTQIFIIIYIYAYMYIELNIVCLSNTTIVNLVTDILNVATCFFHRLCAFMVSSCSSKVAGAQPWLEETVVSLPWASRGKKRQVREVEGEGKLFDVIFAKFLYDFYIRCLSICAYHT